MKTTILIKENRTQLVLHPESDHDKAVIVQLATLPNTHRTNLYDRQGGYTAFSEYGTAYGNHDQNKDLMIVFDTAVDTKEDTVDVYRIEKDKLDQAKKEKRLRDEEEALLNPKNKEDNGEQKN